MEDKEATEMKVYLKHLSTHLFSLEVVQKSALVYKLNCQWTCYVSSSKIWKNFDMRNS